MFLILYGKHLWDIVLLLVLSPGQTISRFWKRVYDDLCSTLWLVNEHFSRGDSVRVQYSLDGQSQWGQFLFCAECNSNKFGLPSALFVPQASLFLLLFTLF